MYLFYALKALGADLKPSNIQSFFNHPADSSLKVYVVLDACHMLKLVRNTFGSYGILKDAENKKINWN